VTSRGRLLVKLAAGQSVALGAVLVVVRAVGVERAALVPARRRGWVTAGGGLAVYAAITAAVRCETLARRPRSRRWITGEFAAVEAINPDGALETALYLPVALQAAVLEELLFRGLLPTALARGGSRTCATRALLPLFGLGHLYQGRVYRIVSTMATGLLLAEVARTGRSIRPAIALHAALDLQLLFVRDHPLRAATATH